jgi:hypothetical protein
MQQHLLLLRRPPLRQHPALLRQGLRLRLQLPPPRHLVQRLLPRRLPQGLLPHRAMRLPQVVGMIPSTRSWPLPQQWWRWAH